MNVLVACEESQEVCKAFRAKGHRAFSCDIQGCSGGHPEWHIHGDVLPLLNGDCTFQTADTHTHTRGAVGSDYRTSTLHRPGGVRGAALRSEAEGRQTAKEHSAVHADGTCRLSENSRRESGVYHVKRMEKTRSDYSAVAVWRTRQENNVLVAQRITAAVPNRDRGRGRNCKRWLFCQCLAELCEGRKRKDFILERPKNSQSQEQNFPRHSKSYGRTMGVK